MIKSNENNVNFLLTYSKRVGILLESAIADNPCLFQSEEAIRP